MDTKLVLDFLNKLGAQLTTTGQQVFDLYTKQAFVDGVTDLIIVAFFVAAAIVSIIFLPKISRKLDENDYGEEMPWFILATVMFIVIIIAVFAVPFGTVAGIKHLMNPQYYALSNLLDIVKGALGKQWTITRYGRSSGSPSLVVSL